MTKRLTSEEGLDLGLPFPRLIQHIYDISSIEVNLFRGDVSSDRSILERERLDIARMRIVGA